MVASIIDYGDMLGKVFHIFLFLFFFRLNSRNSKTSIDKYPYRDVYGHINLIVTNLISSKQQQIVPDNTLLGEHMGLCNSQVV